MYLFDTNILSEVLKKKPDPVLIQKLTNTPGDLQFTSCICVMELRYGSRRRADHPAFWQKIEIELLSRVEVIEISQRIALLAGDVAGELSLRGVGISPEDLLIGVSALAMEMTLVTANIKHFQVIPGLKVENWL